MTGEVNRHKRYDSDFTKEMNTQPTDLKRDTDGISIHRNRDVCALTLILV